MLILTVVVGGSGACRSQPPQQKLADSLQPIESWIATLEMTAEARAANRVPQAFARDTIARATLELRRATETLNESALAPAEKAPVAALLGSATDACRGFEAAIDEDDSSALLQRANDLNAVRRALDAWQTQAAARRRSE